MRVEANGLRQAIRIAHRVRYQLGSTGNLALVAAHVSPTAIDKDRVSREQLGPYIEHADSTKPKDIYKDRPSSIVGQIHSYPNVSGRDRTTRILVIKLPNTLLRIKVIFLM